MKTKLLLFIAVMLHCTIYCQLNSQKSQSLRIGVRGALAYSNLYGSKCYSTYPSGTGYSLDREGFLSSYSAGVWAGFSFSQVSFVGEVNLTEKGQIDPLVARGPHDVSIKASQNYICIPIVLQYNLKRFNRLGFYSGLEYAWLISAKQNVSGNFEAGTTNIKSNFKGYDLGFVAGLNFLLLKGTMIDFRLVNGLEDISHQYENTFVTNKSFQLGFKFFWENKK